MLRKFIWVYLSPIFKCESKGTPITPLLVNHCAITNIPEVFYVLKIHGQRNAT